MHEFTRRINRSRDPDKTNPPTRVEELWGWSPGRRVEPPLGEGREPEAGPHPDSAILLSGNDAITLYWAARDCIIEGAYSGATVLLRRLIRHMTDEGSDEAGTREQAERLLAFAEHLLGRPPEPPLDRTPDQ